MTAPVVKRESKPFLHATLMNACKRSKARTHSTEVNRAEKNLPKLFYSSKVSRTRVFARKNCNWLRLLNERNSSGKKKSKQCFKVTPELFNIALISTVVFFLLSFGLFDLCNVCLRSLFKVVVQSFFMFSPERTTFSAFEFQKLFKGYKIMNHNVGSDAFPWESLSFQLPLCCKKSVAITRGFCIIRF